MKTSEHWYPQWKTAARVLFTDVNDCREIQYKFIKKRDNVSFTMNYSKKDV